MSTFSTMATHRDADNARQRFRPSEGRSATPPAIAGARKFIIDDSADDDDDRNGNNYYLSPSTNGRGEDESLNRANSLTNRATRAGYPPLSYRGPSRPISKEQRSPIPGYNRLYRNGDYDLSARNGGHLPPRRHEYRSIDQEMEQDHNSDDGELFPSHPGVQKPGMEGRSRFSDDTASISKQSITSNGSSSGRMPDFFGPGIFQVVLHNPTTSHQLLKFSESRFCSENVEFLAKVEQYQNILNDLTKTMSEIHRNFVAPDAPSQVNLPDSVMKTLRLGMSTIAKSTLPAMESLYAESQSIIEQLVFTDIYPRFVRYQMTMSASRALARDRTTYAGLGDCFCLTNPAKADNPIVWASDGFVKVTGYTRQEIIPRNCRFLQGQHTDRAPVRRLKSCIDERKESVELLLNYKKNGEPFWNLLYVAPLYNAEGRVAFFIGGQINCSSHITSNADVMRILSTSGDLEGDTEEKPAMAPRRNSGPLKKGFLKVLGVGHEDHKAPQQILPPKAGMEEDLLSRIEGRDLGAQMKEFYTAYSRYIVVKADTFTIQFYSEGVIDMLSPSNNSEALIVGTEIFRFFKQNMVTNNTDYKSKVRTAIRAGWPVSAGIHLQTKRSALFRGDEKFVTHWTPVKDENSAVGYVVVVLAPELQIRGAFSGGNN